MANPSRANFLDYLQRSRLLSEVQLRVFVETLSDDADSEAIANALVEQGLINQWHADNLMKAKYRGFTLGKYRLLGHLGTGGMSSVYLAEHPVMERLVAIKVLPKRFVEDQNYLDRFKREARAAAALDHPNIVRAYDIDQDKDRHYIVMEYIDGRDLQRTVKEDGPVSHEDAADYIAQAARGLQHAHDEGLVHRDIKPANCLLDKHGVVKVLDMGLAKFSEDDRPALSAIYDDSVVGTADYLAPEQAINSQDVDSRADIYSLGCTLYFLLTGQPPFPEGSIAERLLKHQREEPTSIFHLRPDTPRNLVDMFRRMTIKSPDDRIQFASVVEQELQAWLATRGHSTVRETVGARSTSDSGRFGTRFGLGSSRPPSGLKITGDTVSSARGDTIKLSGDSSVNDNLTLAPLEEEMPSAEDPLETSENAETADAPESVEQQPTRSDLEDLVPAPPLVSLLKDEKFAQGVTLPKTQLVTPEPTIWESKWFAISVVGGLIAVALLVVVVTLILVN
jgi:serine/threonine-protein kinase